MFFGLSKFDTSLSFCLKRGTLVLFCKEYIVFIKTKIKCDCDKSIIFKFFKARVIYILKLNTESDKGIVISKISGSEISSHSDYEEDKF